MNTKLEKVRQDSILKMNDTHFTADVENVQTLGYGAWVGMNTVGSTHEHIGDYRAPF